MTERIQLINPGVQVTSYENGLLYSVHIEEDDSLPLLLKSGGVTSSDDLEVFILSTLEDQRSGHMDETTKVLQPEIGGCSVLSVRSIHDGYLFGRNFDFRRCNMLIVKNSPKEGYSSVSTVNPDLLHIPPGENVFDPKYDRLLKRAVLFLPVDGMNEKGLCASVNKIQDDVTVHQKGPRNINHLAGTLIREILDRAADTGDAINILKHTNFHTTDGYFLHFIIADAKGYSVCAEYIDNRLSIVETPIVTNFYLTHGAKYGIGTNQSHLRYDTLCEITRKKNALNAHEVKQALARVAKSNYPVEGEAHTEWSVVYDQKELSAVYYRREDYNSGYKLCL